MISPDTQADAAIDRRSFLVEMPRRLLAGVHELLDQVSTGRLAVSRPDAARTTPLALLDISRCVAWTGGTCQVCFLRCPRRDTAMMVDDGRPLIAAAGCDGCGICVEACRTVNDLGAIRLVVEPTSTPEAVHRPRT